MCSWTTQWWRRFMGLCFLAEAGSNGFGINSEIEGYLATRPTPSQRNDLLHVLNGNAVSLVDGLTGLPEPLKASLHQRHAHLPDLRNSRDAPSVQSSTTDPCLPTRPGNSRVSRGHRLPQRLRLSCSYPEPASQLHNRDWRSDRQPIYHVGQWHLHERNLHLQRRVQVPHRVPKLSKYQGQRDRPGDTKVPNHHSFGRKRLPSHQLGG